MAYGCIEGSYQFYSRYVAGWLLATRESATLAKRLIAQTVAKERIEGDQLIIHSDRGPSMSSKKVAQLLADLGITKSHSRPYVSDDNPFSESQFKTLKYRPEFPERFGCIEDGLSFCRTFFSWYNQEHCHSGIALLTPTDLHHDRADAVIQARGEVLTSAYEAHPERFVRQPPVPQQPPAAVWINPPDDKQACTQPSFSAVPAPTPGLDAPDLPRSMGQTGVLEPPQNISDLKRRKSSPLNQQIPR